MVDLGTQKNQEYPLRLVQVRRLVASHHYQKNLTLPKRLTAAPALG
jgi:hypothetical protein